jgi:AAA domain
MAGELVVVTGPPGAGKSTVALLVVDRFEPSALVSGDAFFGFIRSGAITPWLPAARDQNRVVIESAAAAAGRLANGGYAVVYDGVVGPWLLPAFARSTGLARLHYAVLLPTEEECVARVRARTGHGFTDEAATRQMHRQFAAAGLDSIPVIAVQPDNPEAAAAHVIQLVSSGSLLYRTG